jgi:hypothetical protein
MIRIEPLEKFNIDGVLYLPGEIRHVSEAVAQTACGAGWAKDLDGNIPTGERDPSAKKLQIAPVDHVHGATTPA